MHAQRMPLRRLCLYCFTLNASYGCSSDAGDRCEESAQEFALDQKTPGGISGQEFAAGLIKSHPVQFSALGNTAAKSTTGTLTLSYAPGAVFSQISSTYVPCKHGFGCDSMVTVCKGRFSLPVQATLQADDGSLVETWEGPITAPDGTESKGYNDERKNLTFSVRRAVPSFVGAFKVPPPKLAPKAKLDEHEVQLELVFHEGKLREGSLFNYVVSTLGSGGDAMVGFERQPILKITSVEGPRPNG